MTEKPPKHPLTVIAARLSEYTPGVARTTVYIGQGLAEWIENEARNMPVADERRPGYLDLADRLRNR